MEFQPLGSPSLTFPCSSPTAHPLSLSQSAALFHPTIMRGAGGPALFEVPSVLLLGLPSRCGSRHRLAHDVTMIWASALIKAENCS